jgi:Domain of unknown function (DUF4864)
LKTLPTTADICMRIAALLFLALLVFAAPARAGDDIANAQGVIRAQEQAFSRNDAAAAYSYASPAIKKLFPQADIFMVMVQNSYAPVWRHKSFEFGEARIEGKWVAQRVHIVDADGEAWEAMYTLEQDADGSWEITGCSLLKAGQSV